MAETIAVISPSAIDKDTEFLRFDTPFDSDSRVCRSPLFAVNCSATADINVRRDALDRETGNETAAEVVDRGVISAPDVLRVEPRGINADTEIPCEEIVDPDAAAPSVFADRSSVIGSVAIGVLAEEIDLKFLISEAVQGFRCLVAFIDRDLMLASRSERSEPEGGQ